MSTFLYISSNRSEVDEFMGEFPSAKHPRARQERRTGGTRERDSFIDNLLALVRIHFIIELLRWTGLAPWVFERPSPVSLPSTFLAPGGNPSSSRRGKGFRADDFRAQGQGSGFRVQGSGFRVQGSGFRVQGSTSWEVFFFLEGVRRVWCRSCLSCNWV